MTNQIQRSLFVETREWFDKTGGNSYFSARIWVDGQVVNVLPFQYGYGNHSEYVAQKWLLENDYLPQHNKHLGLSSIARDMGFDYYAFKTFTKKSDMFTPYVVVGA